MNLQHLFNEIDCHCDMELNKPGKVKITVQELTKDSKRNTFRFNHFKKLFGNTCIN